jgi:hypothetical protein
MITESVTQSKFFISLRSTLSIFYFTRKQKGTGTGTENKKVEVKVQKEGTGTVKSNLIM